MSKRYGQAVAPLVREYNETTFQNIAQRTVAFRCLVSVEAAAAKWAGEDASVIAADIKKYSLQPAFDAEIKAFAAIDKCRAGLLKQIVELHKCIQKPGGEPSEDEYSACEKKHPFTDYQRCMGPIGGTAEKKSLNETKFADCPNMPHHGSPVKSSTSTMTSILQKVLPKAGASSSDSVAQSDNSGIRGTLKNVGLPLDIRPPAQRDSTRGPASYSGNRDTVSDEAGGVSQ